MHTKECKGDCFNRVLTAILESIDLILSVLPHPQKYIAPPVHQIKVIILSDLSWILYFLYSCINVSLTKIDVYPAAALVMWQIIL